MGQPSQPRSPDRGVGSWPPDPSDAFSHLATGVTVVATADGSDRYGMTVSAVLTLSLRPPSLLVSLNAGSPTLAAVLRVRAFTVNVLGADGAALSRRFATPRPDKFAGVPLTQWTDLPVLRDSLAWFGCQVDGSHRVGDHVLVVGLVRAGSAGPGRPLIRYRHTYHELDPSAEASVSAERI
jgi:flavin reductase (DIM6/NTAB) family NADH-FMN oxidoreductase RutF